MRSHFAPPAYRSLDDWASQRVRIRQQILVSAGLVPLPERHSLSARRTSRKRHGDFHIEKVVIEPLPGFHLAGNLYVPVNASPSHRVPAIAVPHGHWKHGRAHQTAVYSVPSLCANLASQGYVAFAYDMIGYGDTHQLPHHFGDSPAEQLWSFNSMGLQLWDSIRALDFLESLPEVDRNQIGVTGSSGGGTQAFLLAAVDDRIQAAAPVDMVAATFQGDDSCELAPGLRIGTNNVEVASMMARRNPCCSSPPPMTGAATRRWKSFHRCGPYTLCSGAPIWWRMRRSMPNTTSIRQAASRCTDSLGDISVTRLPNRNRSPIAKRSTKSSRVKTSYLATSRSI